MNIKIINNWMTEISCILMSLTPVNLKQATEFEKVDIPISFLKRDAFKAKNSGSSTVGFSDKLQMKNSSNPTAPVYINMETKCAKWRFHDDDLFLSRPDSLDLVHIKFYLIHEFMHSLGLSHNSDPDSIMYYKATTENTRIFKNAVKKFNKDDIFIFQY